MYRPDVASFTMGSSYDQKDAEGFIRILGLPARTLQTSPGAKGPPWVYSIKLPTSHHPLAPGFGGGFRHHPLSPPPGFGSVFLLPPTPGFGSVFRRQPFTPYFCGVFSKPGCIPEIFYPLNQVPVLKVEGHVGPSEPLDRDRPADRLDEIGPLLSKCLELPPDEEARAGMQVTLKLAFKRNGELLAEPRFTYTTHEAPEEVKAAYHDAAMNMLKRCTPLPISEGLGNAIAGRPFVIPIVETRKEKKAEITHDPKS